MTAVVDRSYILMYDKIGESKDCRYYLGNNMSNDKVNCFKCVFFQITYQKEMPYQCNNMAFKSKILPSIVVKKNSGNDCLVFTPKPGK